MLKVILIKLEEALYVLRLDAAKPGLNPRDIYRWPFQGGTTILPLIFVCNMSLCGYFCIMIKLYINCLFFMMLFG